MPCMCRSPKSEDFQPPKEKKAIGTGIGTLMPTSISFWKRRAVRPATAWYWFSYGLAA